MDVVKELTKVGKDLGLEGEALNTFVSEQQVILRDERQAARDAERERREAEREIREMEVRAERERHERELKAKADEQEKQREIKEYELQLKKQEIELKRNELLAQEAEKVRQKELKERELEVQYRHANEEMELKADEERKIRIADRAKYEAEIALERERLVAEREKLEREYEMQIELQDRRHFAEMERITAQRAERPIPAPRDTIKARTPKIPAFNEGKDEMDAYLLRFERYATAQGWKRESWATDLSALLQGKALDVYALMPQEDAMDYDKLKCALLQRYQLTEEGFKRKYRKCRPETGETFQQFSARLKSYFTRWIDMSGIPKTFEGLQDLMLRDQFTFICNRELELFLREREPTSLEQASKLADSYKEARYVDIVNLTFKNDRGRSRSASRSRSPVKRDQIPNNQNSYGRGRGKYYPGLKCYNCGGTHYRRECPELKPGIMKVGAVGHRGRSPTKKVTFQSKDSEVQTTYEDSHEDVTQCYAQSMVGIFSSDVNETDTGSCSLETRYHPGLRFNESLAGRQYLTFTGWVHICISIMLFLTSQCPGDILAFMVWFLSICNNVITFVAVVTVALRVDSIVTDWHISFIWVSVVSVMTNWWLWPHRWKPNNKVNTTCSNAECSSDVEWKYVRWKARKAEQAICRVFSGLRLTPIAFAVSSGIRV